MYSVLHRCVLAIELCLFCSKSLWPRQNGCHSSGNISKCIFLNENVWISIEISLKFVPKDPINNIPALDQIKACHLFGNKPLSESIMARLLTHIWVTGPQRVKPLILYWDLTVLWCLVYFVPHTHKQASWTSNPLIHEKQKTCQHHADYILYQLQVYGFTLSGLFDLVYVCHLHTNIVKAHYDTTFLQILTKDCPLNVFCKFKSELHPILPYNHTVCNRSYYKKFQV